MVRNFYALIGLYWFMALLMVSQEVIGHSSNVDFGRVWIVVFTITACSVAPVVTKCIANWYERRTYEQWLATP